MAQRVVVGVDVAPRGARISLAEDALCIDVGVQVDEPRRDVVGADVDDRPRAMRRQVGRDARDALADDGDVEAAVAAARRIDEVAVLEQQVPDGLGDRDRGRLVGSCAVRLRRQRRRGAAGPVRERSRVAVVDDLAGAQGEHVVDAARAHALLLPRVVVGEGALLDFQDRDVRFPSLSEGADVGEPADRARRRHRRSIHDLLQRHAEHQHLRHAVRHVRLGGHDARGVDVGADDVGREALAHGAIGNGPQEAAAAVAQVEEHAALARLVHERLDPVGSPVEQLDVAIVVEVRVQIARAHLLEHLGAGVAPGPAQDVVVEDDRALGQAPSLDRTLHRHEPLAAEVRVLDADDQNPGIRTASSPLPADPCRRRRSRRRPCQGRRC